VAASSRDAAEAVGAGLLGRPPSPPTSSAPRSLIGKP